MSITLYPNEPCTIPVAYSSNPLTPYGKDYADIEEVVMCFKDEPGQPETQYFAKYWKDGVGGGAESGDVLIDSTNHTFSMVKAETDTLPVSAAGYGLYLGVKLTGLTQWLWLRVADGSNVIVEADGIVSA